MLEESILFIEISLAIGSDKVETQTLVQSDKKRETR